MNLEKLFTEGTPEEIFILARYCYSVGEPIIDDYKYDEYEKYFIQSKILVDYTSRVYDDDPVPVSLLKKYEAEDLLVEFEKDVKYTPQMSEDKSLSIKALKDIESIYKFFLDNSERELIASVKGDGWNTQNFYLNGGDYLGSKVRENWDYHALSKSRGRHGRSFNITKNISKVLLNPVNAKLQSFTVFGEAFVEEEYLPVLRDKYDKDKYKSPRTGASSLLRVSHDAEDYKHLKVMMFRLEGSTDFKTISEGIDFLEELGFYTVPYDILEPNRFNLRTLKEFEKEFLEYLRWFKDLTRHIPSDGLVIEVNKLDVENTVTNQYSSRNIAVKMGPWRHKSYTSVVEEIIVEQQGVKCSVRLRIKPTETEYSSTAKYVHCGSPRILVLENIKVGDTIRFERDSNAVNVLCRSR